MKTSFKLAAVAAAAALSTTAFAQVAFDANYENNTTYITTGSNSTMTNGGRVELNVGATAKNGDYFITGKATPLLDQGTGQGGAVSVDDAWIALGSSMADVKIGRFEAADLFPLGQDTVTEKATVANAGGYTASLLRGRTAKANAGSTSHFALGLNAGGLRAELGLFNASNTAATTETYGLRPTLVYSAGPLTLRGGLENIKQTGAADRNGYGLSVGYALSSTSSFNLNYASVDGTAQQKNSSIGINGTFGALGLGAILDRNNDSGDSVTTAYASYKMSLLGIKGASFTPALSSSTGTGATAVTALRARINYGF